MKSLPQAIKNFLSDKSLGDTLVVISDVPINQPNFKSIGNSMYSASRESLELIDPNKQRVAQEERDLNIIKEANSKMWDAIKEQVSHGE